MRKPPFHPIHPLKWTVGLLPGLCAGVWGLLAGCQPTLDTRTALIVQTLVDADRDLIQETLNRELLSGNTPLQ